MVKFFEMDASTFTWLGPKRYVLGIVPNVPVGAGVKHAVLNHSWMPGFGEAMLHPATKSGRSPTEVPAVFVLAVKPSAKPVCIKTERWSNVN